jgi:hypothetical protein
LRTRRYTAREVEHLKVGSSRFATFDDGSGKELKISFTATARIKYKPGDSHAVGFASAIVRASAEQVLAFAWGYLARGKAESDDLEKAVDEHPSEHNMLVYVRKKTMDAIDDRDFLGRMIWRKTRNGFEVVATPTESKERGAPLKTVRAKFPSTMKITTVGENETRVEYVIQPDSGGALPSWLVTRYMGSNLSYVADIQRYFGALRELQVWDAGDGVALGNLLASETKEEQHRERGESRVEARVRVLFASQVGLKELDERWPWFEELLAKVAANKLRPASDSKVKLCNMTAKDAKVIGGALASAILANLTAHAAVDEWILRYPAMGELEREYVVRERSERNEELQ